MFVCDRMCVCLCTCVCVCVCRVRVCTCACVRERMCTSLDVRLCVYLNARNGANKNNNICAVAYSLYKSE